ncbi:hypothetical protein EC991_001932 [Linnemannia zychae]|nr:hypothetical protein EC991_001932 [Linnemannia zychae]
MHYGPGIENIENMGEVVCQADSHSSQDEYIQELDKEIAKASIRVMKKHQQKQLRLRLSIDGARPGGSLNGSVVSSTTSTPVSTARCKTSRGTYETASSGPSTPGTPSSARSYFFRCKTARGTYSNSGLPSPTTPNSTRSFLSSLSLKSPTFPHRFSNKVAPSISASAAPPHYATAGPRLPLAPVTQLNNFTNPMDTEGPVMFTKKHMEYIRRIESRLKLLENSATHLALKENEQQLLKRRSLPSQQQQQQTVIADTIPIIEDISTNQQQQRLRTKPSMIRRVDAGFIDPRNARMQKRMSAIDRTDFQSPTGFSHTSPAPPRAYSFHDWASKWSYPTSAETIDFSSGGTQPSPSSAATLEATARLSPRNSSHVLCSNSDNQHKQQQKYTIDRTEHLLEHVNERASSKLRLGMALWEMETLLRQYETLVVQDFQLKLDNLRTSAAANIDTTTTQEQGDEQEHESPLQMSDGRVVRNAQKIPCSLN